jgi:hypothetical protein
MCESLVICFFLEVVGSVYENAFRELGCVENSIELAEVEVLCQVFVTSLMHTLN